MAGGGQVPSGGDPERANRREEILQAAFELFSARGYRAASLGEVAKRVGLTNAGVLHYFSSKEELLTVVLAERDRETMAFARTVHPGDSSLHGKLEQLRAVVARNMRDVGLVQTFTVLAAESVTDHHPAQEFFRARYRTIREQLAGAFEQDFEQHLGRDDARAAAGLVIAVMDGLQIQWLLDPEAVDMEAAFRMFERLLEHLARE